VAAPTALHPFFRDYGLPVSCGHGLHGRPGFRVFSRLELVDLNLMTHGTLVRLNGHDLINVFFGYVPGAMTHRTGNLILTVLAQLPI
jgi:hypothetical protein